MTSPLTDLLKNLDITLHAERLPSRPDMEPSDWSADASHWFVVLSRGTDETRRIVTCYYSMGSAIKGQPKLADVLSSLCLDAQAGAMTFEEYLDNFGGGYLTSKEAAKAHRAWEGSKRVAPEVQAFLGDDFDAVSSAEH